MSFLSPFALALFALSVPLVLLYFLKVRRRERTVSSLLLWPTSLRDREASTFFQRLHRDPLLLLQLLALLALALAVARPVATVMGQGARKVVVVLDTSASMKARDVSPSRFEAARAGAAALVRGLGEGAEVMVIEAGVQPKVTAALARDRERALAAIRAAQARDLPTRVLEAVRTARALVAAEPRAEIHVFTDGAFTLPQSQDVADPRVRWVGVGRHGQNVAITSLSIRKNYYGAFDYQAFVALVNYSVEPQTFSFRLDLDGKSIAEKEVTLEPSVRRSMVLPFSHSGGGTVTARLRIDDDLAVDNTAYAVLPPPRKMAVLLVSAGNLFLEKVLRTDPQVSLEVRTPDQYQGGMGDADVVVLDSVTPPRVGPGRFIFVNAVPPDVPLEVLGRLERPTIMDWDRAHPVMRHVEFAKVTIEDAMRIRPLAAGRSVVEAVGGSLIYALEEPDRKALFIGFDLFKTDFPLRIAFPLVLSNTLRWLHPAGLGQSRFQFAAGQPILLPAPHGVTTVTVTTPSGRVVQGRVTRGMVSFTETDDTGIYTLSTSRGETRVAVNLADADESNLVPHPLPASSGHGPAAAPVPVQRELWPLFVILAVVLLAGEGLLYWRRQSAGRLRAPAGVGDRWALALRSALVAFLCLALLRPTLPRWVDRMNVVFLLDLSDSVSLAARETHAVRKVEQEHDVHAVDPPRKRRPEQRQTQEGNQRAAQRQRPAVARTGRRAQPSRALPPPVEQSLAGEEHDRQDDEERPQLALNRHRGGDGTVRARRRQRVGHQIRLVGVGQIHRHPSLAARRRERVDARLAGLRETHHAAGDPTLDGPAAGGRHRDGRDAVGRRQENRLTCRELEARLVEPRRVEPAQGVREHQRERDPQREIGLEQVEADEERLPVGLLQRVDEGPPHGFDDRPSRRQRTDAHRILDGDLRELDVTHHRVRPVPVHDRRALQSPQHLERHVRRHGVDEDEPARSGPGRAHRIEHDDVGVAHAALILIRRAHLEGHLRIGPKDLLEEQVAGTHEQDRDLRGRRQDRVRDVVDREVVVDAQPRRHGAATVVAERQHDRPPDTGLEHHLFLGDRLAVELEAEAEQIGRAHV